MVDENIDKRSKEAIKCERIIDESVIYFQKWFESLEIISTIATLKSKIESIAESELNRTIKSLKHLSDKDSEAISVMTNSLINKILHDPILFLKKRGSHIDKTLYLDITRKLFKLDDLI